MEISFGKYKGWNTDDLAKAGDVGRNYLAWGEKNLKSEKWRDEFGRALAENAGQPDSVDLHAKAIVVSEGMGWSDALAFAQAVADTHAEMQKVADEQEAEREKFLSKWAKKFGVTRDVFLPFAKKILDAHTFGQLSRGQFTSGEKYALAQELVKDADAWLIDLY